MTKYEYLEVVLSQKRMQRYLLSCGSDKRKSVQLYTLNIKLSQEMLAVISMFEVTLRNAIDKKMFLGMGVDWLRSLASAGGVFDTRQCDKTRVTIKKDLDELIRHGAYTPSNLLSQTKFGVWKYMFMSPHYIATGRCLLDIFPNRPSSSVSVQYNNMYVYHCLDRINKVRNRIAHHDPICFIPRMSQIDTQMVRQCYADIVMMFRWLAVDDVRLLRGLEHVIAVCDKIDSIR